jgi:DNA-binding NarL/FixJ family response regulator
MPSDANGAVPGAHVPRVVVVDLDRRVRTALAEMLRVAGLDVVGTAGDVAAAISLVAGGAEVLVVDPRLPDLAAGEALVRSVERDWPSVRVVIMGWGDAGESRITNNVASFVTKSAHPDDFVAATLAACAR